MSAVKNYLSNLATSLNYDEFYNKLKNDGWIMDEDEESVKELYGIFNCR